MGKRVAQICPPDSSSQHIQQMLYDLCELMVGIVKMVSTDHPWQEILVGVLEDLHARDGAAVQIAQVGKRRILYLL